MSGYKRLREGRRGRGEGGATATAAAWGLGLLALAFLAWAIATTVIAANRVDPPGTFQCGAATGVDGDLCYDYIIVGGGNTGLAAAKKISDDSRVSVLVLEAGQDYVSWDPAVLYVGNLLEYASIAETAPNRYYYRPITNQEPGLDNNNVLLVAGRTLGGGSSENTMIMYRGDDASWNDYDALVGSPGTFDAESMQQVFESIEWLEDYGHYATTPTRGFGQLPSQRWKLQVTPRVSIVGFDQEAFMNLQAQAFGVPAYADESYNNPNFTLGAFAYTEMLWNFNQTTPQQRWSGRFAFLNDAVMNQITYKSVHPRILDVLLNSTVSHLLSVQTSSGPQFVGAKFRDNAGNCRTAYARRGIILSSGPHDSGIMQRSGVGPATVLQDAGISPVLVNENVGANFKTQPHVQFVFYWPNITGVDPDGSGTAPFSQAFLEDVSPTGTPGVRGFATAMIGVAPEIGLFFLHKDYCASSGTWTINSADPYQLDNSVSNALTEASDVESLRDEIRYTIGNLMAIDPNFLPLNIDNDTLSSDTLLDAWIHTNTGLEQGAYFSQTRMGTDPATSVVDNRFRVWGAAAQSLRVCSLSALARAANGGPSYQAAAIGTICGRMVLEDAGLSVATPSNKKKKTRAVHHENKNKTPRHRFNGVTRAMNDADLWQAYQAATTALHAKVPGDRADRMIAAMKQTADYARLCAIYCT